MGFLTFTAGSTLTAAQVNDYLMKQAVIVCTSGTRPASPVEGMTIYETDTDKLLTYDGATWNLPKNVAGGTLGYAEVTANQTGISTITDLTGLSVTVTVGANRRIRITGHGRVEPITTAGTIIGHIREGASGLGRWCDTYVDAGVPLLGEASAVVTSPSAGAHTYKLSLEKSTGGNTVNLAAAASAPGFILVEDIGGV